MNSEDRMNEDRKNIEEKPFEEMRIPVAFPQAGIYDPSKLQVPIDVEDREKGIGMVTGIISEYKAQEDIFGFFDISFLISNTDNTIRFDMNSDLFDDYLFGVIIDEQGMLKILGKSDNRIIVFYELGDDNSKEVRYIISPRYFNEVLLEDYEISELSLEKIDEILNIIVRAREFSAYADDEDFLKLL